MPSPKEVIEKAANSQPSSAPTGSMPCDDCVNKMKETLSKGEEAQDKEKQKKGHIPGHNRYDAISGDGVREKIKKAGHKAEIIRGRKVPLKQSSSEYAEHDRKIESQNPKYKEREIIIENTIGNSGITVGRGVDLGQHSYDEMRRILGIENKELLEKLKPYLAKGYKKPLIGNEALDKLIENPLELNESELSILNEKVFPVKLRNLKAQYDEKFGDGKFDALPCDARIAMMDLYYQTDSIEGEFFNLINQGNYKNAAGRLRSSERRNPIKESLERLGNVKKEKK